MTAPATAPSAAHFGAARIEEVRRDVRTWLREHEAELADFCTPPPDLTDAFVALRRLQRLLFDSGWMRLGWPQELGGTGGPSILRSVVSEELANAGYPPPFSFGTQEVLGPAVAKFAPPALAAEVLPRLLAGEETWCQGFSEPGSGSDLASLQMRAVDDGDAWRVSGEKVWTSWAQFADRCFLLARTGDPASGHRGITAMFLDMNSPGIEVRPLVSINGDAEFCSVFFDDVRVPKSRLIGKVGGGWSVAMFVLSCERGAVAWQRQAWMRSRLNDLIHQCPDLTDASSGEVFELVHALRLLSRRTVRSLSDGRVPGSETSMDKLAMSTAERGLFDAALAVDPDTVLFGHDERSAGWRGDWLYSRASSIYGGAAEIQRTIIAERVIGLPRSGA